MKFRYVDLIRGIAILMVVIVHSSLSISSSNIFTYLASFGQLGVQLFFLASALTLSFSMESRGCRKIDVLAFYIRRFFRIAPMYYIGIIIFAILNYYLSVSKLDNNFGYYTFRGVISNILFIHGFSPAYNNNIVPGGWSIGTEMFFYLVFPLFFMKLKSMSVKRLLLLNMLYSFAFMAILYCLNNISSSNKMINNSFFYFNFFNQLPAFLWGMILYVSIKNEHSLTKYHIVLIPISFGLIKYLWSSSYFFSFHFIVFLSGYVFFVLTMIVYKKRLYSKIIEEIGKRSYSIYILHTLFCWYLFPSLIPYLPQIIRNFKILLLGLNITFTVICSYLLARIFYSIVERFFIDFGNRLIARLLPGRLNLQVSNLSDK